LQNRIKSLWVPVICLSVLFSSAGCTTTARAGRPRRAPADKEKLIKPGELGGAADTRRWLFDFWNAQVIREDVPVGAVFMGDSITEFWELPVYFVSSDGSMLNRGIGGDVASVMAKRFQADAVQLLPRNVIILAGTNDVTIMLTEKKGEADIVRDVTASIESMMDQARAAGINTLVCSILPTNANYNLHAAGKPIRTTINEKIKAACAVKGCIYVDYASQMGDAAGDLRKELAYDGVHPNYAGYEVMTRMLKQAAAKHGLRL
jgi:lysophospholipase L1-like esterase